MNAIVEREEQAVTAAPDPTRLLEIAVTSGAGADQLKELMYLQERWEDREAKKAYVRAMARFRGDCPSIEKTRKGHNTKYAGLADILEIINPIMEECGLSHGWTTRPLEDGRTEVTCTVTHVDGHSERTSLAARDETSGSKNDIQAMGSTVSYLERYTLTAILGIATKDQDDDGNTRGATITDEQALRLEALVTDNGLNMETFMGFLQQALGVEHINQIPADAYRKVVRKVNTTIDAQEAKENGS